MKIKILTTLLVILSLGLFAQDMNVTPGTKMTVESGTQLNFVNGGNLVLEDNASTAPSFLQEGLVNFSGGGLAQVEQYLARDTWHIVSSPVSDGDLSPYEDMYLMQYNEPTESWSYLVEPMSIPLDVGKGYFNWNPTAGTPDYVVLSGSLNSTSTSVPLSYASSLGNPGYNVIGNPYPCALEWNGHADWNLNNVDATIYVYEAGIGGGSSGNYRVYNFNNPPEAQVPEGNDGMIAATQGFWVKATASGASLTIPESQRSHNNKSFYKNNAAAASNILRLQVSHPDNGMYCETVIAFQEGTTAMFDSDHDAHFIDGDSEAPMLFTSMYSNDYMVNFLPSYEDYPIVPLGYFSSDENEFQIVASGIASFPIDLPIYLEDKFDGVFHDLKQTPTYSFIGNPMQDSDRFNVHFRNPLGTDELSFDDQIHIYAYQKTIYVDIPESIRGDIFVYNLLGEEVTHRKTATGLVEVPVHADNSYFVVKVMADGGLKSGKVLIK